MLLNDIYRDYTIEHTLCSGYVHNLVFQHKIMCLWREMGLMPVNTAWCFSMIVGSQSSSNHWLKAFHVLQSSNAYTSKIAYARKPQFQSPGCIFKKVKSHDCSKGKHPCLLRNEHSHSDRKPWTNCARHFVMDQ